MDRIIHAVHFLLISYQVLYCGDDTLFLHTLDSLMSCNALEHRIRTESLPVATTLRFASNGTDSRAKPDVDTFASRFFAHGNTSLIHEALVKGGPCSNAIREYGDMVSLANAVCRIFET